MIRGCFVEVIPSKVLSSYWLQIIHGLQFLISVYNHFLKSMVGLIEDFQDRFQELIG